MDSNTICMHFLPLAMTWLMAYGDNNGNGIKQSGAMKQLKRQLSGKLSNVQKLTPNIGMYPMLLYYITNLTVNTSTT